MQGFIRRNVPLWSRRALTMLPALAVLASGLPTTRVLIISQVALSFGVAFALVPLILLSRRRDVMGVLVNRPLTTASATIIAGLIVALNLFLLYNTAAGTV